MTNGMRTGTGAALWVGDRIRFDGQLHTVVGLSGTIVRLADADGQTWVIHLPHLLADPSFEPTGQREPGPVLPAGLLNGLPQQAVEAAKWWERQLVEVLTGLPPDAPPEARPRS
jgi:putative transposase